MRAKQNYLNKTNIHHANVCFRRLTMKKFIYCEHVFDDGRVCGAKRELKPSGKGRTRFCRECATLRQCAASRRSWDKYGKPRRELAKKLKKDLCTRCGYRPKADGFRFLCQVCYAGNNEETVYSVEKNVLLGAVGRSSAPC